MKGRKCMCAQGYALIAVWAWYWYAEREEERKGYDITLACRQWRRMLRAALTRAFAAAVAKPVA